MSPTLSPAVFSAFQPASTHADFENWGVTPPALALAMDGFVAGKIATAGTGKKTRDGLHLLGPEYRDRLAATLGQPGSPLPKPTSDATVLWQGFRHEWDARPHRLAEQGSLLSGAFFDPQTDTVSYNHQASFRVGAFADGATLETRALAVKAEALRLIHGEVGEERLTVSGKVGEEGVVRVRERVDLATLGLNQNDNVTVVLNGFNLRCLTYVAGYNTRGYGVRVIPVGMKDGAYEFDVEFKIHPAHAPDRPQPDDYYVGAPTKDGKYSMLSLWGHAKAYLRWLSGPLSRSEWLWGAHGGTKHLEEFSYTAKVGYSVIGVRDGFVTNAGEVPTNSYVTKANLGFFNRTPPETPLTQKDADLQGAPGFGRGVVGLQGFSWHLAEWPKTKRDGRYIRTLEFSVPQQSYDAALGRATLATQMFFSNEGTVPTGFNATYAMWNSLIQFNDVEADTDTEGVIISEKTGSDGARVVKDAKHTFF